YPDLIARLLIGTVAQEREPPAIRTPARAVLARGAARRPDHLAAVVARKPDVGLVRIRVAIGRADRVGDPLAIRRELGASDLPQVVDVLGDDAARRGTREGQRRDRG